MKTPKKTDSAPKRGRGRPKKEQAQKNKVGRPSKKTEQAKEAAQLMYRKGFTDAEVAKVLQLNPSTIAKWKQNDSEFLHILRDWKIEADERVEKSLYQRACGYDKDGRHYPPDPTSAIFWLKNRKRNEWRDKTDIEHTGNVIINAPIIDKDE